MKQCIFPGSFDPITIGHMDIIKRARAMFDKVIVAVLINESKSCKYSLAQRVEQCNTAVNGIDGVEVVTFSGLLSDLCNALNVYTVVRGIRNLTDYLYESDYVGANKELNSRLEFVLLQAKKQHIYISSGFVKTVMENGGDVEPYVPQNIIDKL